MGLLKLVDANVLDRGDIWRNRPASGSWGEWRADFVGADEGSWEGTFPFPLPLPLSLPLPPLLSAPPRPPRPQTQRNPPNQTNLTPSLPGKIHIPTPRAPLLRHRQALSPLPLPPHLRLPILHAHREHLHPRRRGLDGRVFLYDFVAVRACGELVGYVGWGADGASREQSALREHDGVLLRE